jgi:hypothetical protein
MTDQALAIPFADALRPFRRRLQLVRVMELLPVACGLSVGFAAAIVLTMRPGALIGASVLAAGALTGALVAVTWVAVFPPSLGLTAATIDRAYALESRAVTALEFGSAMDAISQRIVSDARAHLVGLRLQRLTWSAPRHAWWAASVAVLGIAGTLVMASSAQAPDDSLDPTYGAAVGGAPVRTASAREHTTPNAESRASEASRAVMSAAQKPPQLLDGATEAGRADSMTTERSASAEGLDRTDNRDSRAAQPASARSSRPAPLASVPADISASAVAGAATTGRSSGPSGAAAGGSTVSGTGMRAGGVSGGGVISGAAGSAPSASSSFTIAQYRQAVAHAEVAIAQQRVPAKQRAYVRDYFLSLREAAGR